MDDHLYEQAIHVSKEFGKVSIARLQRKLRLSYVDAAHILDRMMVEGFCRK